MKRTVVNVAWLIEHLSDPKLIVLDASSKSNVGGLISSSEGLQIEGARFFDLKGNFVHKESEFPNTVPSAEQFQLECRKLGINGDSQIVVYDNLGIYSSPRVWWLFKSMGHEEVAVLDGGLPEWVKAGGKTEDKSGEIEIATGDFEARFNPDLVKSYEDVVANCSLPSFTLVDARSRGRFEGKDPEPRKTLQSGCIPNSVNIPYRELLEDGKFKSRADLRSIFESNCQPDQKLVFSCGSGLTACIVMLACEIALQENRFLFDGSWTEWAERQELLS